MSKKPLLIVDFNEVLVNISPKWVDLAYQSNIIDRQYKPEEVLSRPIYRLDEWLRIDEPIKKQKFLDLYEQNLDTFYDDLLPNPIVEGIRTATHLSMIKVVCISHVPKISRNSSKEKLFERLLENNSNCKLITVEPSKTKASVIKEEGLDYFSTFIDDSLTNILDVLCEFSNEPKEYFMPSLGYNDYNKYSFDNFHTKAIEELIDSSNSKLRLYDEVTTRY